MKKCSFAFALLIAFITVTVIIASAQTIPLWTQIGDGMGAECFTVRQDGELLIHAGRTIFLLRSGEVQPDTLSSLLDNAFFRFNKTALNPRGELFAAMDRGLWKSQDQGKNWVVIDSSRRMQDIAVNDNGYIYLPGGNGLFSVSRDNGESWFSVGMAATSSPDVTHLSMYGNIMVVGATDGMYYSDDNGETFQRDLYKDDFFHHEFTWIYDLERHPAGFVFVGIRDIEGPWNIDLSGTWRSDIVGRHYMRLTALQNGYSFATDSLYNSYAFSFNEHPLENGVFRSTDSGRTWKFFNEGRASWANTVHDMITTPDGYVYTGGTGIFRTIQRMSRGPAFWGRTQSCNTVEYVVMDSSVNSVQIVPAQSNNVRFEVLSPLGGSKVKIRLTLFDERIPGHFTLRALNAQGMETVYSDTLQKIFPEPVIHQSHDTLWGNGGYVYQWYRNGELLEGERREFLVPAESGSYSVQVLNAYGCEQRSAEFAYVLTPVEETEHPMFSLEQNTPNPCDGVTILHYNLPHRSPVCLTVSDVTGRIVGVVAEGMRDAGEHTAEFDVSGLAPGVYFYRLDVNGTVISRQMTVFR